MMLRSRALLISLGAVAASSCVALACIIAFGLPRDATLLATGLTSLNLPFGSGLLLASTICFAASGRRVVFRTIAAQAWIQGSAEVAALLATFAAFGSTLTLRRSWGDAWHAVWWSDQRVMFFMTATVLYGVVALLARWRPLRAYAATVAVLGPPLPFLVRTSLTPICTLYSKASPMLPSLVVAFSVALGTGVSLAAFAIFVRTRLAYSSGLLQRAPH